MVFEPFPLSQMWKVGDGWVGGVRALTGGQRVSDVGWGVSRRPGVTFETS